MLMYSISHMNEQFWCCGCCCDSKGCAGNLAVRVGHTSPAAGSLQQLMCCLCRRKKVFLPSLDEPAPARREEGASAGGWRHHYHRQPMALLAKQFCQSLAELHLRSVERDGVPQNLEIKSREQAW